MFQKNRTINVTFQLGILFISLLSGGSCNFQDAINKALDNFVPNDEYENFLPIYNTLSDKHKSTISTKFPIKTPMTINEMKISDDASNKNNFNFQNAVQEDIDRYRLDMRFLREHWVKLRKLLELSSRPRYG
ncbi:hypothetical protein SNEBB_010403 [Seison nebaliae]|nr:hypothetical protein SNEBB_010403 [Seison nebaliae]